MKDQIDIDELYVELVKAEEKILIEALTKHLGHEPSIDEMKRCARIFYQNDMNGRYQFTYMGKSLGTMHKMYPSVTFPVFKLSFIPDDGSEEQRYSCQIN